MCVSPTNTRREIYTRGPFLETFPCIYYLRPSASASRVVSRDDIINIRYRRGGGGVGKVQIMTNEEAHPTTTDVVTVCEVFFFFLRPPTRSGHENVENFTPVRNV